MKKVLAAFAALCLSLGGCVVGGPLLVVRQGFDSPEGACIDASELAGADGPTILGPSLLHYGYLTQWWDETERGQPARLGADLRSLIAMYEEEGSTEGVRGDIAFAQAVHETGYFTNSDTGRNNFAGIAHYDGTSAGQRFPDARTGVRAHIQLLKKYAAGNDTPLVHPDVAPSAGASATTWAQLAGTWATDPSYGDAIATLYEPMLHSADIGIDTLGELDNASTDEASSGPASCNGTPVATESEMTEVNDIIIHVSIAGQLQAMLDVASSEGVTLTGSGYRSGEEQIELRRLHCGTSQYAVYEMPSSQCSPPTARPGTSMHGQGLAVDFENCSSRSTACFQWLAANAATYGFYNLPSEPWHWSIDGT